jgi:hypothetical protein
LSARGMNGCREGAGPVDAELLEAALREGAGAAGAERACSCAPRIAAILYEELLTPGVTPPTLRCAFSLRSSA